MKFNRTNYANWSKQMQYQPGAIHLDLAMVMDEKPTTIIETSTKTNMSQYEVWERFNRLSLSLMKMTIAKNVEPSMPKADIAREFMKIIKKYS